MKVGDLVIDDKSHMNESNWFYNAFKRIGVVTAYRRGTVDVMWTNHRGQWTAQEHASKLEVISENKG